MTPGLSFKTLVIVKNFVYKLIFNKYWYLHLEVAEQKKIYFQIFKIKH